MSENTAPTSSSEDNDDRKLPDVEQRVSVTLKSEWDRLIVAEALWSEINAYEETGTTGPWAWDFIQSPNITLQEHWERYEQDTKRFHALEQAVSAVSWSNVPEVLKLPLTVNELRRRVDDLLTYIRQSAFESIHVDDAPRTAMFLQETARFLDQLEIDAVEQVAA